MDEDTDLIKQYVSGSEYAIEELVLKYQKQIYAFIYRMINDIEEAKDLTQQTFIKAAEGLKDFRGDSSFRTWLYQIAKNTSINKIRQGRPEETELEESIAGNESGALSLIIKKERMEHIRKGLDRLPERQRLAVILRVYEEMSCRETAGVMGCSEGAVKAHYHNGVNKLREFFKEMGYEIRA